MLFIYQPKYDFMIILKQHYVILKEDNSFIFIILFSWRMLLLFLNDMFNFNK